MDTLQDTPDELRTWWEQYEAAGGNAHHIEVYLRSVAPAVGMHERCDLILQLQAASEAGLIGEWNTTVLGDGICLCESCRALLAEEMLPTLERLRNWEFGPLQASGFTEHSVRSSITGENFQALKPPELSFGVYRDGSLVGVFPCASEDTVIRPDMFLDKLQRLEDSKGHDGDIVATSMANRSL